MAINDKTQRVDFSQLLQVLDGNDPFMTGHQIIKTAGATSHSQRLAEPPVWTRSTDIREIVKIFEYSFPHWREVERVQGYDTLRGLKQYPQFMLWLSIFYLYYKVGKTEGQIGYQMFPYLEEKKATKKVHDIITRMNRVAKGVSANGTGTFGRPRGRPKRIEVNNSCAATHNI